MKKVEQVAEVRTSTLGVIMLTIMVIFIFSVSQTFLSDISSIITKPLRPSPCIIELASQKQEHLSRDICQHHAHQGGYYSDQYDDSVRTFYDYNEENYYNYNQDNYYDYNEENYYDYNEENYYDYNEENYDETRTFLFSQTDITYSLDSQYNSLVSKLAKLFSLNKSISDQQLALNNKRTDIQDQDPDLNPIELQSLKQKIKDLEEQRAQQYQTVKPELESLQNQYEKAYNKINSQRFFYIFAEFLLQLIFVLPIFIIALRKYFQLKKNNSPYTVIASAVVTATSLLLLQVVLGFLFEALPWGYLEKIWLWFQNFQFLKYIVYYATVILTIAVFGGVVYYIQKNTYASDKVAKRRVLKGQCPNCETKIKDSYNNCRGCGIGLTVKCSACHKQSSKFFNFCAHCGSKLKHK